MTSSNYTSKKTPWNLEPAPAWTAMIGIIVLGLIGAVPGLGRVVTLFFPVASLVVGFFLYSRYPILYLGYTWWLWFLTPFVRRLADFGSGYTEPSPILLSPFLVTALCFITLFKQLPKLNSQGKLGTPFVLAFIGLFYSLLVGIIYREPTKLVIATLEWFTPVIFGFHLYVNWRSYPQIQRNIERVFLYGVLIVGSYGVLQYVALPQWDRIWLTNAPIDSICSGGVEVLKCRVYSTLNSPEPFAGFMAAGLLLLLCSTSRLSMPAQIAGYLSFLLAMVRSGWLGWFAGFLALIFSLKEKFQIRLILVFLIMIVCIAPLTQIEQFSGVTERLGTFGNLENDGSADARQETYEEVLGEALTNWFGQGIGGKQYDSTLLALLMNLGWIGTIFYGGGMLLLILNLFYQSASRNDAFATAMRGVVMTVVARLPLNSPLKEVQGIIFWGFLGLGVAAHRYYQYQKMLSLREANGYSLEGKDVSTESNLGAYIVRERDNM
ncbi:O-antigen ligase like membrane family protein [Hyella patelloides LEGE 07179]|uniref:O-antigen ligase like membrane family protein n=1 Tax=Hyella patelloides LEGE 07179 TaxID=945734 RepID=A0A563VWW5_9CYAN|nr:O-antigen ligase family protein [Hyella patelloides]VEP15939.1 O-antigen ligase like membrane family protein [Hyella patelloides LEGE 07179]